MASFEISKFRHGAGELFPVASVAAALAIAFIAATLPTPLYAIYRRTFGFSEFTLTLIYAVYVLGNLAALFLVGRLSDQIGRRIAVLSAIGFGLASTVVYIVAAGTASLFAARVLSGFATGIASGGATAWIAELQFKQNEAAAAIIASAANLVGLAVGALAAGLLAQFAPWPLRLAWLLYLIMLGGIGLATLYPPETVEKPLTRLGDLSLRPRLGVPENIRLQFVSPAVTAFVIFALIGFYAALIPTLLSEVLNESSPVFSGLVVFELFAVAAVTVVLTGEVHSRGGMLGGLALLFPSLLLLAGAELARSAPVLIGAAAVAGITAGLGYRGSLEVVNQIAPPGRRGEMVSSYLIAVYAGNSLPVIGVGVVSAVAGLLVSHALFAVLIGALAAVALITGVRYAPTRNGFQCPRRGDSARPFAR